VKSRADEQVRTPGAVVGRALCAGDSCRRVEAGDAPLDDSRNPRPRMCRDPRDLRGSAARGRAVDRDRDGGGAIWRPAYRDPGAAPRDGRTGCGAEPGGLRPPIGSACSVDLRPAVRRARPIHPRDSIRAGLGALWVSRAREPSRRSETDMRIPTHGPAPPSSATTPNADLDRQLRLRNVRRRPGAW
jgi:hypothetical protein